MKGTCIVPIFHTKGSPGCFTITLTTIKQHTHVCKCTHRQTCTHIWNTQTHENWRRGVEMAVKKHCLEIAVEQVVLWTDLKEEEELECLRRQTVRNRCANIRKWSFSKCFCVYTRDDSVSDADHAFEIQGQRHWHFAEGCTFVQSGIIPFHTKEFDSVLLGKVPSSSTSNLQTVFKRG